MPPAVPPPGHERLEPGLKESRGQLSYFTCSFTSFAAGPAMVGSPLR
jgi:hypothetical protein